MMVINTRLFLVFVLLLSAHANAGFFHYNDILVGDRAHGMGGAYTAIADDASAVYYNPAGIGFTLSNDVQASANVLYNKRTKYKNIRKGQDYIEETSGFIAPFFGALRTLDTFKNGLVFAFAMYNPSDEQMNQNNQIRDDSLTNNGSLLFLDRKLIRNYNEQHIGASLAYRYSNDLSFGFSLTAQLTSDLAQDNQYIGIIRKDENTGSNLFELRNQMSRIESTRNGLEVGFGMQTHILPRFVFGMSIKGGILYSQLFKGDLNYSNNVIDTDDIACDSKLCKKLVNGLKVSNDIVRENKIQLEGLENGKLEKFESNVNSQMYGNVFNDQLPLKVRLGLAYFASTRLLLAFDAAYVGENSAMLGYDRAEVIDYHLGVEYYHLPNLPMRLGIFTNHDATPSLKFGGEKVDYLGTSLFFSWVQPNSQIGIGTTYQRGFGLAKKDEVNAQKTESEVRLYSLSLAYSL